MYNVVLESWFDRPKENRDCRNWKSNVW